MADNLDILYTKLINGNVKVPSQEEFRKKYSSAEGLDILYNKLNNGGIKVPVREEFFSKYSPESTIKVPVATQSQPSVDNNPKFIPTDSRGIDPNNRFGTTYNFLDKDPLLGQNIIPVTKIKQTPDDKVKSTLYKNLYDVNSHIDPSGDNIKSTESDFTYLQNGSTEDIAKVLDAKKSELLRIKDSHKDMTRPLTSDEVESYSSFTGPNPAASIKNKRDIIADNQYNDSYNKLLSTVKQIAFDNAPKQYDVTPTSILNDTPEQLLIKAQQIGNDVTNIDNNKQRNLFNLYSTMDKGELIFDNKVQQEIRDKQLSYSPIVVQQNQYQGIQAIKSSLVKERNNLMPKIDEISSKLKELQETYGEHPTKELYNQIQQLHQQEYLPLVQQLNSFDASFQKVNKLENNNLGEIKKQTKAQEVADSQFESWNKKDWYQKILITPSILPVSEYDPYSGAVKGLLNHAASGGKSMAMLFNSLGMGGNSEIGKTMTQENLRQSQDFKFAMPKRLSGSVFDYELKDVTDIQDVKKTLKSFNFGVALAQSLNTTTEMLVMGAIAAPISGASKASQFAGMFTGSSVVFGGDVLQQELDKGLSLKEAVGVTTLRMVIEAGSEMINPLELQIWKGFNPTGQLTKQQFREFIGNNWKTILPKLRRNLKVDDIINVLYQTGKQASYESVEEVMADLGNYGLDREIIENIKPDYQSDGISLESLTNTFANAFVTMLPAGGYGGFKTNKANKAFPYIQYRTAITPNLFLENLEDAYQNKSITKEYKDQATESINRVSNIYEQNKVNIEAVDEELRPDYLNLLSQQEQLTRQISTTTDEKESERLGTEFNKVSQQVLKFNELSLREQTMSPEDRKARAIQIHLDNIAEFKKTKGKSEEELIKTKETLENVAEDPVSPEVGEAAKNAVEEINTHLEKKESENITEEILDTEELSDRDYASKVLNYSEDKIDKLELSDDLKSEVSKHKKKTVVKDNLEKAYTELSKYSPSERNEYLEDIKNKAIDNNLFELADKIDALSKEVTIKQKDSKASIDLPVNTRIQYQGDVFEVQGENGIGKLVNIKTGAEVIPSNINDIKVLDKNIAQEVSNKAQSIEENELQSNEKRATSKTIEPTEAHSSQNVSVQEIPHTEAKEDLISNDTVEAEIIAEDLAENQDNPINPFRNSFYNKNVTFGKVIAKLSNIKDLAKAGYYVSVMKASEIPSDQLVELGHVQHVTEEGRYLVITDKEGIPIGFDTDGNKATDKGAWALSVFPKTESENKLSSSKFKVTNQRLKDEGKTKEWFNDQVAKLHEARKSLGTFIISTIHKGAPVLTLEESRSLKEAIGESKFTIDTSGRHVIVKILGKPNISATMNTFSKEEQEGILEMLFNPETRKNNQDFEFIKTQLGMNYFHSIDGQQIKFVHQGYKDGKPLMYYFEGSSQEKKALTKEKLQEWLPLMKPNIDFKSFRENKPFTIFVTNSSGEVKVKKFDTYQVYIVDNAQTYSQNTAPESFFLEVGDKVNSESNQIEEVFEVPSQTTIEEAINVVTPKPTEEILKKEENVEIIKESPIEEKPKAKPIKGKVPRLLLPKDRFKDKLDRAKNLYTKVSKEQSKEAEQWFKKSPLSQFVTLNDFRNIVNSDAFATWTKASITLWNGSEGTSLYHEAWHEFSQLFLTKEQKQALYNEVLATKEGQKAIKDLASKLNKSVDSLTKTERNFAIEELIAEDFREYVLSNQTKILNGRPKRNSIFRRIFNFFKELFTGNVGLQTYYERLYNGNINKYQRNLDNAFFGNLNQGITGVVNGELINLSNAETKALYNDIDSAISNYFEVNGKPITYIFENNNVLKQAYKIILGDLKANLENYQTHLETLDPASEEYLSYSNVIKNTEFTIQNWDEITKSHLRKSKYLNISTERLELSEDVSEDNENEELENENGGSLSEDISNDRDSSVVKNENVSSKSTASNEVLYLIASLPEYLNGETVAGEFLPFYDKVVGFNKTWDVLTKELNGTLEYKDILGKIKGLESKYPWANDLLKRLPPSDGEITESQQRLKAAFVNDLSKPKIDVKEVVITKTKNKDNSENLNIYYQSAESSDEKKTERAWDNNFQDNLIGNSRFVDSDNEGLQYLNLSKVIDAYSHAFPERKEFQAIPKEERNDQLFLSRIDFLKEFGIEFSDETLVNEDFETYITNWNSPAQKLFDLAKDASKNGFNNINALLDRKSNKSLNNYNPSDRSISFVSKITGPLLEQELKYSDAYLSQSVKNANQDLVWQIQSWSYITKLYSALNDEVNYPTYEKLVQSPWLKNMDNYANPYVSGIYLNSLFNLKTGERRRDSQGKAVKIYLTNYNGVRANVGFGTNPGKTTTGLTALEKQIQNFNTLLKYGVQENLRYGDKSSAYATEITHIYNPTTNKLESRESAGSKGGGPIIPITDFKNYEGNLELPEIFFTYMLNNLKSEMVMMKENYLNGTGNNWEFFGEHIKANNYEDGFAIFNGILSKETKQYLVKEFIKGDKDINVVPLSKIREDVKKYTTKEYKKLSEDIQHPFMEAEEYVDKSLFAGNVNFNQLKLAYTVNSLLYNIEHTKIVSGDPRFYKNPGDIFKRLSAYSANGTIYLTDEQTNSFIESKGNLLTDVVAKRLGVPVAIVPTNGDINSVIWNDVKGNSKALLEKWFPMLKELGASEKEIESIQNGYSEITEADGQGVQTLDLYRQAELRAGSNNWTPKHEKAYLKEVAFLKGESKKGASKEEIALFVPKKFQVAGFVIDNGRIAPVFYKYSVAPLIPSMIKGTPFESIHDNMVRQGVGMGLFKSGSKLSAIKNEDGKFNKFYDNQEERTPYTGDYTINTIRFEHLKEQINIEPKLKEEVTFSTQMRKLLNLNLFKDGIPIYEFSQKITDRFADIVEKLIDIERQNVLKKMGATFDGSKFVFDNERLQKFFVSELEARNLPDEVINYFQVKADGSFTYPIDASNRRDKIEKIAYSIANRKLVRQKVNGEALIQLAITGFETGRFSEVYEDAGLPFYEVKDGKTTAMKVKIAFSKQWSPLLNLTHTDGKKIETLERLNEVLKDEKWVEKYSKNITIVGVRIPVQGLNSQEFMEVFEFLPEEAGPVIIMSPYIVAKSGGDFDIDKLSTYFPNLNENGGLVDMETGILIKKQLKHIRNKLQTNKDKALSKIEGYETLRTVLQDLSSKDLEELSEAEFDEHLETLASVMRKMFGSQASIEVSEDKINNTYKELEILQNSLKSWSPKKALENEMISIIAETLSKKENFVQLVSPNSTDLLQGYAERLKNQEGKEKTTWSGLVESREITRQFNSNLVGKYNLGIAALYNTFFALTQRAGLVLNNEYTNFNSAGRATTIKNRLHLKHNEVDGKISMSGLKDVKDQHFISKIYEQMINGFVDIAKDDWIFYINGVREIVPTMLYVVATGVNNYDMITFFNQPVLKEYVKEIQLYNNLFLKVADEKKTEFGPRKALENIFERYGKEIEDTQFKKLYNEWRRQVKIYGEGGEYNMDRGEIVLNEFGPVTAFKALLNYTQDQAEINKDLFTSENLETSVFKDLEGREYKEKSPFENLMILAHYEELKAVGSKITNLQQSVNADTKKIGNSTELYSRKNKLENARKSQLFDPQSLDRLLNESTVKAYTNEESGFDTFAGMLFKDLFEITGNPNFNRLLQKSIETMKGLLFKYKGSESSEFIKVFKSDFITYLYQNNIFIGNELVKVFNDVKPLFKAKTSLYRELVELRREFPTLSEKFPILGQLTGNKSQDNTIVNIVLKKNITDTDELNSAVNQIRSLLQFNDSEFTPEEQIKVQNFTKKLVKFLIIQSGLNPSKFNLMDLVPNEEYTKDITPFIKGYQKFFDEAGDSAIVKDLNKFISKFRENNSKFFDHKYLSENEIGINRNSDRLKNYIVPSSFDATNQLTEKAIKDAEEYSKILPTKTLIQERVLKKDLGKGNLVIFDENPNDIKALKNDLDAKFIPNNFTDSTLQENRKAIDSAIQDIVGKSKDKNSVVFKEKGYAQSLKDKAPKTFQYISEQLYSTFGYENPNFIRENLENQEESSNLPPLNTCD